MTRSQFQRALFVMLGALAWLLVAILFVLITKDDWHLFGVMELIATVVFFLTIPIMCWISYRFGIYAERTRPRERIDNVKYIKK